MFIGLFVALALLAIINKLFGNVPKTITKMMPRIILLKKLNCIEFRKIIYFFELNYLKTVRVRLFFFQDADSSRAALAQLRSEVRENQGELTTSRETTDRKVGALRDDLRVFSASFSDFLEHYDHNNRPVQPLNDRRLELDENPTVTPR